MAATAPKSGAFGSLHRLPSRQSSLPTRQDFTQHTSTSIRDFERDESRGRPERISSPEYGYQASRAHSISTVPRSVQSSRSLAESAAESYETNATSVYLPALQTRGAEDEDALQPLQDEEIDPGSFDLVLPSGSDAKVYSLEQRSELLFSKEHLAAIFEDSGLLQGFTHFLCTVRTASVPLLVYYLEAEKALRAIRYSNTVAAAMKNPAGQKLASEPVEGTVNATLQARRDEAFEALVRDELPMYITHVWVKIVSLSIKRRIAGTMPAQLRETSEGLAEVFCLTDPSRHDNPIIMASEEFHRTTQYGMSYVLGRNCRFLQGPKTNPFSIRRIREKLANGEEHFETFLNYRRDGSPFLNLLLCAPLIDSRGKVRYFLGAQVDVSGLAKQCSGLEGLRQLVEEEQSVQSKMARTEDEANGDAAGGESATRGKPDSRIFQELSEMFNAHELETVRRHGGAIHHARDAITAPHEQGQSTSNWHKPHILIEGTSPPQTPHEVIATPAPLPADASVASSTAALDAVPSPRANGRLTGVYEHYLLVRPTPGFRILFASPSLRVPGILQSPFLARIGGSGRVRAQVAHALSQGHGVTAKVRWVSATMGRYPEGTGRWRWIHCTPLLAINGGVGVWIVVIVDEEGGIETAMSGQEPASDLPSRRPKMAPQIDSRRMPRRPFSRGMDAGAEDNLSALNVAGSWGAATPAHADVDSLSLLGQPPKPPPKT